ncbi:amino acid ABC transporter substrate-binding protein [Latilactobacillus sakei]|uniref:amino acid ABC transporter substrate-binding protein n=1 Tax=Latilactobacillus sakei TaxID=1599 RepID=UPI0020C76E8A|nr:amino acid ABC transporter substrate-binding protein [Latilactobacillus sakei]MCP8852374.1 amino acid ABC transporter substrate-binding protein [Latilactobacillus sakei]
MMRLKRLATAGLLLGLLVSLAGCHSRQKTDSWVTIERRQKVVIGIDDSFVPMTYREKNGQLTGFDVELAKAIFKGSGIQVDFQSIDWDMKETELNNQTIDLIWSGYSKTEERAKRVAFSQPYLTNHQMIVSMKQNPVNRLADLKGQNLGVQTGSSGMAQLDRRPTVLKQKIANQTPILYDTYNNAFIDLQAKRIKGILIDQVYANFEIKARANGQDFQVIESPFAAEKFAVGMRPEDQKLRRFINRRYQVLKQNGQLAKIQAKWFKE